MQILEILIAVLANTCYDQSPVIQEQVDRHRACCINWLESAGLPRQYNQIHHHRKCLGIPMQRFPLWRENGTHV